MSARWSTASPRNCSGAMYSSVPTMAPAIVRPAARASWDSFTPGFPAGSAEEADRAIPKSMIMAWPVPVSTMMLAGLRSRCTTPALCAATSPDTTPRATVTTCSIGSPRSFFFRIDDELGPVDVRHRDVLDAVDLAHVVDAHDVRVSHLPGEQELALEALLEIARGLRVLGDLGAHDLDRDPDPELLVPGAVHGAHPAEPEQLDDVIAPELLPDLQGTFVAGGSGGAAGPRRRRVLGRGFALDLVRPAGRRRESGEEPRLRPAARRRNRAAGLPGGSRSVPRTRRGEASACRRRRTPPRADWPCRSGDTAERKGRARSSIRGCAGRSWAERSTTRSSPRGRASGVTPFAPRARGRARGRERDLRLVHAS